MKALDLYCGAGGVSVGLQRAGFEVVGVDINPQPHHRGGIFVQADAMTYPLEGFDLIWASPPCQRYSGMSACRPGLAADYPDLIGPTRERLAASGIPWVIENVPGAPLLSPILLCGQMFGLELYRHRLFEASFSLEPPHHPDHVRPGGRAGHWRPGEIISVSGHCSPISLARKAMGIDWMPRQELAEAIPPAYAEWIGRRAADHIDSHVRPSMPDSSGISPPGMPQGLRVVATGYSTPWKR